MTCDGFRAYVSVRVCLRVGKRSKLLIRHSRDEPNTMPTFSKCHLGEEQLAVHLF